MSWSETCKSYRARVAYAELKRAMRLIDNEEARDRTLEAMDILWMEMSEDAHRHCTNKAIGAA